MDTKTNEKVLSTLIAITEATEDGWVSPESVQLVLKDISLRSIEASFADLKSASLVLIEFNSARLLPKAYGYFDEKLERKRNEFKKLAWDAFKTLTPIAIALLALAKSYGKEITYTWQQLTQLLK